MDHEFSRTSADVQTVVSEPALRSSVRMAFGIRMWLCLLYTSDAADEL